MAVSFGVHMARYARKTKRACYGKSTIVESQVVAANDCGWIIGATRPQDCGNKHAVEVLKPASLDGKTYDHATRPRRAQFSMKQGAIVGRLQMLDNATTLNALLRRRLLVVLSPPRKAAATVKTNRRWAWTATGSPHTLSTPGGA